MRRNSWCLLIPTVFLIGCGSAPPPAAQEAGAVVTPVMEPAKKALDPPNFDPDSSLVLQRGRGGIKVGNSYVDATSVFAAPTGWWPRDDLPPSITPPFEARGWQSKGEGFGTILHKGRVAAAVYELDRTSDHRVDELLAWEEAANGTAWTVLPGKYVRYWFWKSGTRTNPGDQLLMVCATEIQPRKFNVTAAIGTATVMYALSMTPETASRDQQAAEKLIDRQRASSKGNSANSSNRPGAR